MKMWSEFDVCRVVNLLVILSTKGYKTLTSPCRSVWVHQLHNLVLKQFNFNNKHF